MQKFCVSFEGMYCCLVITDTKNVWGEVLSGNAFARRWRETNLAQARTAAGEDKENEWRKNLLRLLTNIHSIGGIADLSFEVVPSHNADLAFELGSDDFKWRWETYTLGPKVSADVLSKQLIMPLISVSHLAFSSPDPVSELSDTNLQMAIDKTGRTGRRAVDTHVKHAISRPRLATTMRRMSAVFSFLPELPPVVSKVDTPELVVPKLPENEPVLASASSPVRSSRPRTISREPIPSRAVKEAPEKSATQTILVKSQVNEDAESESVTEEEEDDSPVLPANPLFKGKGRGVSPDVSARKRSTPAMPGKADGNASPYNSRETSPKRKEPDSKGATPTDTGSGSQIDGVQPLKRLKKKPVASSSSDEDSDAGPKRRVAQTRNAPRGAKQPIKRGGRRF